MTYYSTPETIDLDALTTVLDDNAVALLRVLRQEVRAYGLNSGQAERAWQDFEEAARECADNRGGLWFAGSAGIVLVAPDASAVMVAVSGEMESHADNAAGALLALACENTTFAPTDGARMVAYSVVGSLDDAGADATGGVEVVGIDA